MCTLFELMKTMNEGLEGRGKIGTLRLDYRQGRSRNG